MWPWSLIKDLRCQIAKYQEREAYNEKWRLIYEKLYLERSRDLRAAHVGIKRLKQKLKKYDQQKPKEGG